jgi:hypothetical protein
MLAACTPGNTDAGTFSACLDAKAGQFSNVTVSPAAPAVCGTGAVAVSWSAKLPDGATTGNKDGAAGKDGATGKTGADGPTGAAGATGATGAQGAAGTDGTDGAAGPAGANGTNGVDGAAGATGPAGATGAQGTAGPQGIPGAVGPDGSTGPQGLQGATGAQGIQGIPGLTGNTGAQGLTGAAGATGAQGIQGIQGIPGLMGNTGAQGLQGQTGATGATGAAGLPGSDGNSIRNGSGVPSSGLGIDGDFYLDTATFTVYGPKAAGLWPVGGQPLIGPQGPIGPQGVQGSQGVMGAQGVVGNTGATGAIGATGPAGPAGPQGPAGAAAAAPVLLGSTPFIDAADATGYLPPAGTGRITVAEADAAIEMPTGGTLAKLAVRVSSTTPVTFTVVVGGADTALTCTVAAAAKQCTDSSHTVAVAAGTTVSVKVGNGGNSVQNLRYSMSFGG